VNVAILGCLSVVEGQAIRLFSECPEYLPGGTLAQHDLLVPPGDTFTAEIAHFLACIQSGEEPITSARSQHRPLAAVLAAYRSMESGRPESPEG
jgi:predicted dehydrogenase